MCVCVSVSTCVCLCVERVAKVATYVSVLVPEEMALFRAKLETCRDRGPEDLERGGECSQGPACASSRPSPSGGTAALFPLGPVTVPCWEIFSSLASADSSH